MRAHDAHEPLPVPAPATPPPQTTSQKKLAMYLVTVMMVLCSICGFLGMCMNRWVVPVQAKAEGDMESEGLRRFG